MPSADYSSLDKLKNMFPCRNEHRPVRYVRISRWSDAHIGYYFWSVPRVLTTAIYLLIPKTALNSWGRRFTQSMRHRRPLRSIELNVNNRMNGCSLLQRSQTGFNCVICLFSVWHGIGYGLWLVGSGPEEYQRVYVTLMFLVSLDHYLVTSRPNVASHVPK